MQKAYADTQPCWVTLRTEPQAGQPAGQDRATGTARVETPPPGVPSLLFGDIVAWRQVGTFRVITHVESRPQPCLLRASYAPTTGRAFAALRQAVSDLGWLIQGTTVGECILHCPEGAVLPVIEGITLTVHEQHIPPRFVATRGAGSEATSPNGSEEPAHSDEA